MTTLTHGHSIPWNDPSLTVDSDPARRARYRRLQSWYRHQVLGVGAGEDRREIPRANMLPRPAVEQKPHLNFLSPAIGEYARARAAVVAAEDGTLDEDRLYRNMLSSMPMCFNLFGQFRIYPDSAARLLSDALGLDIAAITTIDVEWTPSGEHPLGDRTAFDAYVEYLTADEQRGFLGVETKYTEPFSRREYDTAAYREWTTPQQGFKPGAADELVDRKTNQLWRNLLLAVAVRDRESFAHGHVVVIAPDDDRDAEEAVTGVGAQMTDPDDALRHITLNELTDRAAQQTRLAEWAGQFRRRYCEFPEAVT